MKMNKTNALLLLSLALLVIMPDTVFASSSISELSSPIEKVVGTITGPVGRWIAIAAMAISGIAFVMKREEIEGAFKTLLKAVIGISFIALAASIIDSVFSFSGAIL